VTVLLPSISLVFSIYYRYNMVLSKVAGLYPFSKTSIKNSINPVYLSISERCVRVVGQTLPPFTNWRSESSYFLRDVVTTLAFRAHVAKSSVFIKMPTGLFHVLVVLVF
jgi:hypothetical protein